ncbi:MAG TPA: arylsulfatase [Tepidisphaeraceae bacterium]|nr:arylsulfatase [Tepidisphaeraceae bacterium]
MLYLLACLVVSHCVHAQAAPRPNIVLILADDMGFSDVGCYGSEIATPNIDRLAAQGVRFTEFYNTGRCCPTRASLLTGLYAHQAGVGQMIEDRGWPGYRGELNNHCITLAEALNSAGYRTDMVGKWHLVHMRITGKLQINHQNQDAFWFDKKNWPIQRGFKSFFGTIIGVDDYFDPFTLTEGNDPLQAVPENFYYTDSIADHAARRITENAKAGAPFFLYVAFTAPHWPLQARPEDIAKYEDAYAKGWDELRLQRHEREKKLGIVDPKWTLSPRDKEARAWDQTPNQKWDAHRMAVYAAQIDRLDQGIGVILKALDDSGSANNTMVIFLSDNGGCAEKVQPGWFDVPSATRSGAAVHVGNNPKFLAGPEEVFQSYGPGWANASNTPFRRYKHFAHEGGIATPFVVRWPAAISQRGAILKERGHVIDLMPTFLELAGGKYPASFNNQPIEPMAGQSLVAALLSQPHRERGTLFWEHEGNRAVRDGQWKLVAENNKPWELYDMIADRTETHDLAAERPEKVKELQALYSQWADRVGVKPWPTPKAPDPRPKLTD